MARLNSVNVIEYRDDSVVGIGSFTDDAEGNKQAEEVFSKCAKENGANDQDLQDFALEDGMYEAGNYQVFLVHSGALDVEPEVENAEDLSMADRELINGGGKYIGRE